MDMQVAQILRLKPTSKTIESVMPRVVKYCKHLETRLRAINADAFLLIGSESIQHQFHTIFVKHHCSWTKVLQRLAINEIDETEIKICTDDNEPSWYPGNRGCKFGRDYPRVIPGVKLYTEKKYADQIRPLVFRIKLLCRQLQLPMLFYTMFRKRGKWHENAVYINPTPSMKSVTALLNKLNNLRHPRLKSEKPTATMTDFLPSDPAGVAHISPNGVTSQSNSEATRYASEAMFKYD